MKEKVGHTPGPWFATSETTLSVDAGGFVFLLTAPHKGYTEEIWRANQRLIAAAPDLLNALRGLVEKMPRTIGHNATGSTGLLFQEYNAALAAIAKAEGK